MNITVSNKKEKKREGGGVSSHSMARKQREEEESAEVEGQLEECWIAFTYTFISLKNSSKMASRFQHFHNRHRFLFLLFNSWTNFLTQPFQLRPLPWYVRNFSYSSISLDSNSSCRVILCNAADPPRSMWILWNFQKVKEKEVFE